MLLFVALIATDAGAQIHTQQIVRTDTVTRRDTIITTEVVRRTEIINRTEEIIYIDTVFGSDGSRRVIKRSAESVDPVVEVIPANKKSVVEIITAGNTPVVEVIPEVNREDVKAVVPSQNVIEADGGKYIWVPDSMSAEVNTLLSGHSTLSKDRQYINLNEKVIFRGDTIPMLLRDRNLGRYNRGLFNYLYIPKGIWQLGITASYGEFSTEDLEMFDLISDVDFHGKIFSVRPYFSYFFKNNMSLGMRLGYSYGRANVDSFNVDIDDDMNFNLHDIMYRSETYTAAIIFNQYFGIARRGRFAIFNEVELAFSGGNADFIRPYNNELKATHTTTMQAALNFSPGLSVFIIEPLTFNISFGVFGFSLKNEKQTVDGEELGSRFTSGANFRFNIFNINFGIAVNI